MKKEAAEMGWKLPELLAPAGGFEQLKAAVENGADAVYMGGKLFNARIGADNFDACQLEQAIAYAHLRGVKIHVTVNTLLTDRELPLALAETVRLYEEGADGFIIQDLGFARILHRVCPEIPMHLSTQGTVYNWEGVRAAGELGFSRVVLARETSLAEIAEIKEMAGEVELEVFVHGALCISYSGQCQMSRHIGGRSGNRGVCAQPCRLPWTLHSGEGTDLPGCLDCSGSASSDSCGSFHSCGAKPGGGRPGSLCAAYSLSPRDLCAIPQLPALCRLGVDSLKIEGRMKSAEYVAVVTSIYRKYLDQCRKMLRHTGGRGAYDENWENQKQLVLLPEDEQALRQIFSRGSFTEGYFRKNPKTELMSGNMAKHQGILIGTAVSASPERKQVTIRLSDTLSLGDGIEIHTGKSGAGKLPGNVVTFLCGKKGQTIRQAEGGQTVTAGDIDSSRGYGKIRPGDQVFRITKKSQMSEAKASYENRSGASGKEGRKTPVEFHLEARRGQPATLRAVTLPLWEGQPVHRTLVSSEAVCEQAINRPLTETAVREQLNKTGNTSFRMAACKVDLDENISLPLSRLNNMRRQALEALEQKCLAKRPPLCADGCRQMKREVELATGQTFEPADSAFQAAGLAFEPTEFASQTADFAGRTFAAGNPGTGKPAGRISQNGEQSRSAAEGKRSLYLFRTDESFYRKLCGGACQKGKFHRYYLPYLDFLDPRRREWLAEARESLSAELIPTLPQITQGETDRSIRSNWDRLTEAALTYGGISVGNLGWLKPFLKEGVAVYGDYGLNLYSSADFALMKELGLTGGVISHELTPEQASGLFFHGLEVEVAAGGSMPLMVSRHNFFGNEELTQGILEDRKGQHYPLLFDPAGQMSMIFSEEKGKRRNLMAGNQSKSGACLRFYGFY